MRLVETVVELRQAMAAISGGGAKVGFVPTMGFLHDGHLSLVRAARARAEFVVLSIFVNPAQFGPREDLTSYPRDLARDRALAAAGGVDLLFVPAVGEIYPPGFHTFVRVEGLEDELCGRSRPGHFRGVATVVLKLLSLVRPHTLYLGEKDAQQLVVLGRMVADLELPVEVVGCPIVREADGLAMSSRNVYLSAEERRSARAVPRAIDRVRTLFASGVREAAVLTGAMREALAAEPGLRLEYAEVVDPLTLKPVASIDGRALAALAVVVGRTRLIDNARLGKMERDKC